MRAGAARSKGCGCRGPRPRGQPAHRVIAATPPARPARRHRQYLDRGPGTGVATGRYRADRSVADGYGERGSQCCGQRRRGIRSARFFEGEDRRPNASFVDQCRVDREPRLQRAPGHRRRQRPATGAADRAVGRSAPGAVDRANHRERIEHRLPRPRGHGPTEPVADPLQVVPPNRHSPTVGRAAARWGTASPAVSIARHASAVEDSPTADTGPCRLRNGPETAPKRLQACLLRRCRSSATAASRARPPRCRCSASRCRAAGRSFRRW